MVSRGEKRESADDAELTYLRRRVIDEAQAAVGASSTSSTLIHVILATAYAKRIGEPLPFSSATIDHAWADQHRLW